MVAIAKLFTVGTVEIGSTVVPVNDMEITPEIEDVVSGSGNTVFNEYVGINIIKPVARFTTHDLAAALGAVGDIGAPLATGGTTVKMYFKQRAAGALDEGANKHIKLTITTGIIIPVRMTGTTKTPATITYEIFAIWDGTNLPYIVALNQSLPTLVTSNTRYYAGRSFENANEVTGNQSHDISFGNIIQDADGDADEYPTFVSIANIAPRCTSETLAAEFINTLGTKGVKIATPCSIFFRKGDLDGTRVAWATAAHVKVTVNAGMITPGTLRAALADKASMGYMYVPRWNGINNPFVIVSNGNIT